ncbi:hypothetical protein HJD18_14180 [Thermoleophilia bacterium SCSIO 60948]|nr:hypothetical protein HJD18_14180 [Thermoleophilia bacterium SCSIO 60948]
MKTTITDAPEWAPQLIELASKLPTGDMINDRDDLTELLRRLLEATSSGSIELWDTEGEELYGDEFSPSPEEVAEMSAPMRAAYVAKLARSFALCFGMPRPGEAPRDDSSHAGLAARVMEVVG